MIDSQYLTTTTVHKMIKSHGGALTVVITPEARLMGLDRGDPVDVDIEGGGTMITATKTIMAHSHSLGLVITSEARLLGVDVGMIVKLTLRRHD